MKELEGAINKEKILIGTFSEYVHTSMYVNVSIGDLPPPPIFSVDY